MKLLKLVIVSLLCLSLSCCILVIDANFDSQEEVDGFAARAERNSKFISTFNTNWIDPDCSTSMSNQKYKIIGTTGRIECDQKNRGIELVSESKGVLHVNPYFSEFLYDENGHNLFQGYGYKIIYQYLSDTQAIIEKKINWWELCDIRPTFKDTYYSIAVIEAVNKALLTPKEWRNIDASI